MMKTSDKYYNLIKERIHSTFRQWETREYIMEKEMYFFLHNMKGTAGTVGVEPIASIASEKLRSLTEDSVKEWSREEWMDFMRDIYRVYEDSEPAPLLQTRHKPEISSAKTENKVILLIDDDVDFVAYMKESLEQNGFHVIIALTTDKGLDLFYSMKPNFVMLDISFPQSDGMTLLEQIVEVAMKSFTPIAIISGKDTMENRIRAYSLGATDFIKKPVQEELLIPYLHNRLRTQEEIQNSIMVDELTGSYTRKYMNDVIDKLNHTYTRHKHVFSIALIDLDHFKQVNDQYGHLTGDQVLKGLVDTVRKGKRETDYLFRFGGEEFVLVLPDTGAVEAKAVISQIQTEFSLKTFSCGEEGFRTTFSAGITEVRSSNNQRDRLLEQADHALYDSKKTGRNMVNVFAEERSLANIQKLHFIIVDDDPLVRAVLEKSFLKIDFGKDIAVIVHSFQDGVEFLESDWYDPDDKYLLLLDGIMPKMDGIEVLLRVRTDYPDRNIVVSMLSARSGEGNIIQALEKGADDYMLKPFNVPEVMARMERMAKRMLL